MVPIAMKRHHSNSYKGKHLIMAGLQFRGLVCYCHGRKHGSSQADRVLKKEWRALYSDRQAPGRNGDTLPPTKPCLLIVPVPMGLWGPFVFKLHTVTF